MYGAGGWPSIPPERLLKASLLISLYSVRSERAFCEELDFQLLWRWFLDISLMEPSFDQSRFSKNRGRLLKHVVAQQFFDEVVRQPDALRLLSDEHFTVDGTLIEAAASLKSFKAKDTPASDAPPDHPGNPTVNFRGEKHSNATHQSTTGPEARLAKKGRGFESKLAYLGHALMENRHGLLVEFQLTYATGTAERDVVPQLLYDARLRGFHPRTLGADKAYDARACVATIRECGVTPHVAQNTNGRRSAIDRRTTRHAGYSTSQRIRKRVEGSVRLDEGNRWLPSNALSRTGKDPTGGVSRGGRIQPGADRAFGTERDGRLSDPAGQGTTPSTLRDPASTACRHLRASR
jgi:transposase